MYWLPCSLHTSHHPSQTPCLPSISYASQSLMLDSRNMVEKQSEAFHTFLWHFFAQSLRQNFIIVLLKSPHCILGIHQLWQSGFSRVYSNCCCCCSFKPEIIKIGQSSHKMYSNNIMNFQESTTILNACKIKSGNLLNTPRISFFLSIHRPLSLSTFSSLSLHFLLCLCLCLCLCLSLSLLVVNN